MTALEREDIEALSVALYKIPKTVEKIAERIMLAPQFLNGIGLGAHLSLLEKGAETVVTMIKELRRGIHLGRIRMMTSVGLL